MINANTATCAHPAEAGHRGKDVRSDLHVAIEPRDSGGIEIDARVPRRALLRRVDPQPGRGRCSNALGVKHARIAIHDEGALPFVICRAHRSGGQTRRTGRWHEGAAREDRASRASDADRLRRSRLYLPGQRAQVFHQRRHCTGPTPSFSIWKTPFTTPKKMRRDCWCAMRCAPSISAVRAHGSHQPVAAGAGRSGGDCSRISRPGSDSQSGEARTSRRSQTADRVN